MFKLLAVLALMFVAYLLLVWFAPPAAMLAGFMIGGVWIAYWWCGLGLFGWLSWRAL